MLEKKWPSQRKVVTQKHPQRCNLINKRLSQEFGILTKRTLQLMSVLQERRVCTGLIRTGCCIMKHNACVKEQWKIQREKTQLDGVRATTTEPKNTKTKSQASIVLISHSAGRCTQVLWENKARGTRSKKPWQQVP